ncbi:hypothetical protein LO772_07000 [Yinghuangia sp. ASG 101]|uniref:hypothetical protein n=1 Tax=Yinghuangia sp. ASG 101 TaxID=2896848 RepID=UPI001E30BBC7|nr:hypothetical protein [Yinghuangia sp. ASG 101]UGQ13349.1 hypothetical protein LO772_07000 [Yinghuangia sp. ASG 101]
MVRPEFTKDGTRAHDARPDETVYRTPSSDTPAELGDAYAQLRAVLTRSPGAAPSDDGDAARGSVQ